MIRLLAQAAVLWLAASSMTVADTASKRVTWTGWFSDVKCASGRAASGVFTATNPDCARKCIQEGAAPVFISEQARAVFTVKDHVVLDDLGYHVEIQATVDAAAKTISDLKVKRLEYEGAACGRPKKK
jgi:hypothetical protein